MANIKQQIKRARQDEKHRQANAMFKSGLKTAIKRVETAAAEGNKEAANTALITAHTKLDKALAKGLTHKNKIARQKSRLQRLVNSL